MISRHGQLTIAWGDGSYTFHLRYGEILKLEEACDAGPDWIANRVRSPEWRAKDVYETIRLGLIGGGMSQGEALDKVKKFVVDQDGSTWDENRLLAYAIIGHSLRPPKDDPIKGKAKGARKTKAPASREEKQPSQDSSVSPP